MKKMIITILVLTVCVLLCGGIVAYAGENSNRELGYKYYSSRLIEAGDTLWGIASELAPGTGLSVEEYIRELKTMNGLQSDTIHAGNYLTVSYYSAEYK